VGIDLLPRRLFRYVVLGLDDEVAAHSEAVYQCLLCKLCEDNCTGGVHIVANVRALRGYFTREVFGLERHGRRSREEEADAPAHP
jgi:heterodisulfide reductase subunit C